MSKARGLADLGNAFDDGALSNRNLIINGAMQVAQRGTSATGIGINAGGPFICDRFQHTQGSTGGSGVMTMEQSTDGPDGFGSSLKLTVTTADTLSGGENVGIRHRIEGQNVQHLKFGSSSAESVTLSFWVKASLTGTYSAQAHSAGGNRTALEDYTVSSANTWEYKKITFVGDTGTAIANDNTRGFELFFSLDAGPDDIVDTYTWSDTSALRAATGQVNFMATSGATWQITGVQLEVGDTATPFEHRSYGDELARCQRYYQKQPIPQYVYPTDGGQITWMVPLSVPLRAAPSVSPESAFYAHRKDAAGIVTIWDGTGSYSASIYDYEEGEVLIRNNFDGGVVSGMYTINASSTSGNSNSNLAKLFFDAEL